MLAFFFVCSFCIPTDVNERRAGNIIPCCFIIEIIVCDYYYYYYYYSVDMNMYWKIISMTRQFFFFAFPVSPFLRVNAETKKWLGDFFPCLWRVRVDVELYRGKWKKKRKNKSKMKYWMKMSLRAFPIVSRAKDIDFFRHFVPGVYFIYFFGT